MKEFLPILIGFIYFAFQIYSNFKKEQEKARKRNPGQRPAVNDYQPEIPKKTIKTPQRRPVQSQQPQQPDYLPDWMAPKPKHASEHKTIRRDNYKTAEQRTPAKRIERQKPLVSSAQIERRETMKRDVELPEEVLRLRAYKEQKRRELLQKSSPSTALSSSKMLAVEILDSDSNNSYFTRPIHFDLEQAVIHASILERKEY